MTHKGEITITNDGATILKSITVDNPAAKVLIGLFFFFLYINYSFFYLFIYVNFYFNCIFYYYFYFICE